MGESGGGGGGVCGGVVVWWWVGMVYGIRFRRERHTT